jgi:hypothetical protein
VCVGVRLVGSLRQLLHALPPPGLAAYRDRLRAGPIA